MRKRTLAFAGLLLLGAAGPAASQTPAEPQKQPEPAAAPRESSLNLKLDEAELRSLSRGTSGSRERPVEPRADGLPSLGGEARRIEQAPQSSRQASPYPLDPSPGQ